MTRPIGKDVLNILIFAALLIWLMPMMISTYTLTVLVI